MELHGVVTKSGEIERPHSNSRSGIDTNSSAMALFFALKRRGVLQAGTSYVVVAWLIAQVADVVGEIFSIPSWFLQALLVALALGLPVTLVLSWAFELTPLGLRRDPIKGAQKVGGGGKGRGLVCALIAVLVLTIAALTVHTDPLQCSVRPDIRAPLPTRPDSI